VNTQPQTRMHMHRQQNMSSNTVSIPRGTPNDRQLSALNSYADKKWGRFMLQCSAPQLKPPTCN